MKSSKPPRTAGTVGDGEGEQAGPLESATVTAPLTEPNPQQVNQSLSSDTHSADGPKANFAARRARSLKEAGRARAGHAFSACSPPGLLYLQAAERYFTTIISYPLFCGFFIPSSWHKHSGHSFLFSPISPTNWLPAPMLTSWAVSFYWRLAAAHHLRGARNMMVIGAVWLPDKMALMELLFDLLCFVVFFSKRELLKIN